MEADIITEIRKLLLELVIPELRAIGTQLRALGEEQQAAARRARESELLLLTEIQASHQQILEALKSLAPSSQDATVAKLLTDKKKLPPTVQ